jgi:hypothetical protein
MQEQLVPKESPVRQAQLVGKVHKGVRAQRVLKVLQVLREFKAFKVFRDWPDQWVRPVRRVPLGRRAHKD